MNELIQIIGIVNIIFMMAFIFSVRRKISTEESILEAIEGLRGAFRLHKSISDMMYSQIAVLESRIVKLEAKGD